MINKTIPIILGTSPGKLDRIPENPKLTIFRVDDKKKETPLSGGSGGNNIIIKTKKKPEPSSSNSNIFPITIGAATLSSVVAFLTHLENKEIFGEVTKYCRMPTTVVSILLWTIATAIGLTPNKDITSSDSISSKGLFH